MAVKKTTLKKTKDGTVDKRTKEGKESFDRFINHINQEE